MHRSPKSRSFLLPGVATGVAALLALCAVWIDSLLRGPAAGVSLAGSLPATTAKAVDILVGSVASYVAASLVVLGAVGFFVKGTLGPVNTNL